MDYKTLKSLPEYLFNKNFPNLRGNYLQTSFDTIEYNCIAFIFDEDDINYSSYQDEGVYWPDSIPKGHLIKNYSELFIQMGGFIKCNDSTFELGIEKIALYGDIETNEFLHVAKQLDNGHWSSKMGEYEDIEHYTLEAVSGNRCGQPLLFMKRNRKLKS